MPCRSHCRCRCPKRPITAIGTTREHIRLKLLEHEIEAHPVCKPIHLQPLYAGAPYHGQGVDARLFKTGLCLPSGSDMSDDQQAEVIGHILALLDGGAE